MDDLILTLSNGTRLVVPPSLDAITTYVLLEQETWFEKEFGFLPHLLAPGMTAVDIGANLGTYSIAMARLVGPSGAVIAYEPTSATRARLAQSRDLNGATNLIVVDAALSDSEREGYIVFGGSSELNHLGDEGDGEGVRIASLDAEFVRNGWPAPDFIKMDAEGEEIAIIRGAERLLTETSPIVMLEIKAAEKVNTGLADAIGALGYRPYRLLPGAPLLVPLDLGAVDGYELNMLAVKDDRAAEIEARGLLVREATPFAMSEAAAAAALDRLKAQPFAGAFPAQFATSAIHPAYLEALAAYDVWLRTGEPLAVRWGALQHAVTTLTELVKVDGRIGRLSSLARMAAEAGRRTIVAPILQAVVKSVSAGQLALGEPFWPASPRYDAIAPGSNPGQWFLAAVTEQFELSSTHSTLFAAPSETLGWLSSTPFATPAILRRQWLDAARRGDIRPVPPALTVESPDHLNADVWADGTVPALARGA